MAEKAEMDRVFGDDLLPGKGTIGDFWQPVFSPQCTCGPRNLMQTTEACAACKARIEPVFNGEVPSYRDTNTRLTRLQTVPPCECARRRTEENAEPCDACKATVDRIFSKVDVKPNPPPPVRDESCNAPMKCTECGFIGGDHRNILAHECKAIMECDKCGLSSDDRAIIMGHFGYEAKINRPPPPPAAEAYGDRWCAML